MRHTCLKAEGAESEMEEDHRGSGLIVAAPREAEVGESADAEGRGPAHADDCQAPETGWGGR